jgi:anti-sigma B factor antagonist
MDIQVENEDDVIILTFNIEQLNVSDAKELKERVAPLIQDQKKVIFDMNRVQYVDSSGLGVLVGLMRSLSSKGGALKLANVSRPVTAILELVRMHRLFEIYENRELAKSAFSAVK